MHIASGGRTLCGPVALLSLFLAACGGGGSGSPGSTPPPGSGNPPDTNPPGAGARPTISTSSNVLNFSTANLNNTPSPQRIPLTVTGNVSGSLYVTTADFTGDVVAAVETQVTVRDGQATVDAMVFPRIARDAGPGTYNGTFTVNACINDSTCQSGQLQGSPLTVTVTYTVESSVQGDIVAPRVVTAGESGSLIIRGRGFSGATSVRFGSVVATTVRVNSDTEIRATYPTLDAGDYPVSIDSGAVAFTGSLIAVAAPVYAPDTLEYGMSTPQEIGGVVYDAQRQALIVVSQDADSRNNAVTRFQFRQGGANNTFGLSSRVTTPVPDIRDAALSPDGKVLLAATHTSLMELHPVTILPTDGTAPPAYSPSDPLISSGSAFIQKLAIANDGYAVVATGGAGPTNVYLYSTTNHSFYTVDVLTGFLLDIGAVTPYFGNPAVSADGSTLVLSQDPGTSLTSRPPQPGLHRYNSSSQRYSFSVNSFVERDRSQSIRSSKPALDRAGTRIVLNGPTTVVTDSNFLVLGNLPVTTRAAAVKPDASRVYTFDAAVGSENGELRTFDLTSPTVNGMFRQVGAGIPMSPGSGAGAVAMVITPDGGTIFVVGTAGVWVQPTP